MPKSRRVREGKNYRSGALPRTSFVNRYWLTPVVLSTLVASLPSRTDENGKKIDT